MTTRETKVEDSYEMSLQIAKRYRYLTLRGGLIQMSGGVGLDAHFFDDRLTLTGEAWDFSDDDPHLKFSGRFEFYPGLFLVGGYDHPLSDERSSPFFGGGLHFTDQDLKYLIGFLSVPGS